MAQDDTCIIADEFGPLERIVLPGQSVSELADLIAAVHAEIEPSGTLGRMFARDIALRQSLAEYLRTALAGLLDSLVDETMAASGGTGSNVPSLDANKREVGKTISANFQVIQDLITLEMSVSAERDRIVHAIDSRRLNTLKMAFSLMEKKAHAVIVANLDEGLAAGTA